jgi:DNA primase
MENFKIEKDFLDKLRSSILVSEVVGKKVRLKLRGKEFVGLCPFHSEKSPSFIVNDQKGFYHCFGCAADGDIVKFLMSAESLNYKDAIIKLVTDFDIPF